MKKILLSLFVFGVQCTLLAQTSYFVSNNGNDTYDGSLETPFKTISKALALARGTEGDVQVYIREGQYHLSRPLVFTSEDGHAEKHLLLSAYSDERVVLSGGVDLQLNWQPYRDGIMKAEMQQDVPMDMLTVNGEIRHMARYPNYDSTAVRFNGTSAEATSEERIRTWKNPKGGFLHAMHVSDWGDFHYRMEGKDEQGHLKLEGGWQNNRQYGLHKENRMVENIFEELDAPGEWFYDAEKRLVYYFPLPEEDLGNAQVEVANLKHLIEFRGTRAQPVENIEIKGLELTQTARTFMEKYEPLLRSDWTVYRGAAVFFEGTENCKLTACYLHNLGGNAVFFSNYNRNSGVSGSHFTEIGASAICFVGDPAAVRSPSFEYSEFVAKAEMDRERGHKTDNYPAHCFVHDNLIHRIGLFEKQITGVELSMSQYIRVSHNSIYDVPRAGINISEGTWGGHIIEYNDVFDTVKETGDHGAFNSWGRDRFWHPNRNEMNALAASEPNLILADAMATVHIRNNRFRCDRGWDIDLDDGSSNYRIYNNLCLNGGIKLREGFYRIVENNIMVNNTFHPHVWFQQSGDVFTRNIVMSPYQPIQVPYWGKMVDYNVFTDEEGLAQAAERKTDEHSVVYPVHFVDPIKGDYSVSQMDSTVFRMGFQNFDMQHFGVLSPNLKRMAREPRMSIPLMNEAGTEDERVVWSGFKVKNLNTLGERSATGMDSERGVYVVALMEFHSALRDYLQANDVILELAGMPINTLSDLKSALLQIEGKQTVEMLIFRNQKANRMQIPADILKKID
ncbi:DUF1565 domain-containing protein [Marinilongibacter aquaticus]|uniref:PDZ domain-containing protein n=1 Tax=Marinilongibacter aquaticus TaxID=2975157 RepID=UPI0021BDE1F2|nr:PDZ domain-containing protein [Marinilongibacter aquaticus]UBM59196.1 DUF1565 domain-containing protein [Marinilongibacter aquaticus]